MSAHDSPQSLTQKAHRHAKWLAVWQSRGALARTLYPLSWLFEKIVRVRRAAFLRHWCAQYRMPIPVVVVGGIMVGGVGKTPIVARLVQDLREAGFHPVIVSRGYGGANAANHRMEATRVIENSLASEVGDEPLQLAMNTGVPVWVGQDRVAVARAVCVAHPECDVIVSDDGLQHYHLYRDIELVVMDERGVGNGWCLPAGPLREPPARLNSVFAIVQHSRGIAQNARAFAWMPEPLNTPQFAVNSTLGDAYALLDRHQRQPLHAFVGQKVLRCAGIARPQVFFEMLAGEGIAGETLALPDHAPFDESLAQSLSAMDFDVLLLTEKDAVKCLPWVNSHSELARRIWVVPLVVAPNVDWTDLSQQIVARLRTIGD
ncbi:MAG: lpxK [Burkholderiaceae bacterium]|nr:lpxK [Burkholderiaceae bacterium]